MKKTNFTTAVIISTFNNPEWLKKVLWGYVVQISPADEIIIADDGSGEETRTMIEEFSSMLPIKHVWQPNEGFQKSKILNKAISVSTSDYLIFTDQDCIPRKDFIAVHKHYAKRGRFLSGGYFKLPMNISLSITKDDIESGRIFSLGNLLKRGLKMKFKCIKLFNKKWFAVLMNHITTTRATWNGMNSSGWREDALKVNGFNMSMQYGGQDREFGERLRNLGIRTKQIRYSAICLHLYHNRPYKTRESIMKNIEIRRRTRSDKTVKTSNGIEQL